MVEYYWNFYSSYVILSDMKKILAVLLFVAFTFSSLSFPLSADAKTKVRGYTKKSGTYVAPHYRTDRNRTKLDNWSTKGNRNPYTGKKGYKKLR